MRVPYAFEEADAALSLLPYAARRALDAVGLKVSLEAWRTLSLDARMQLMHAGAGRTVDLDAAREALRELTTPPPITEVEPEPDPATPPPSVVNALPDPAQLTPAVWSALSPLDRYTLLKVSRKGASPRVQAAWREIVGASADATHLTPTGTVRMVDTGAKAATARMAEAVSRVRMSAEAFEHLVRGDAPKGDVLATARIAGILAAKQTSALIPLCHPLSLTRVEVRCERNDAEKTVEIVAHVEAFDRTGVEMEALTAASVAALTVYDMLKAFDRAMEMGPTRLVAKSGGRSGEYRG